MLVSKLGAVALCAVFLLGACSSDDENGSNGSSEDEESEVIVFAAASLTGAFEQMAEDLEAAEPGLQVLLSFDSSSSLAAQIVAGSPADVFASADLAQIEVVRDEDLVASDEAFATNRLQVITPADNPAGIERPEDLADPDVTVILAAEEVPVGNYARQFFDELGILDEVEENVVSNEQDVKDVLTKIRLGEADAGVVYVTDVTPEVAEEVQAIDTPELESTRATYGIAVIDEAQNAEEGQLFYDYVLSDNGAGVLGEFGFEIP